MERTSKRINTILFTLCLSILFAALFTLLNFNRIKEATINSQKDFLNQTADYTSTTIQTFIKNKQLLLRNLSEEYPFTTTTDSQAKAVDDLFNHSHQSGLKMLIFLDASQTFSNTWQWHETQQTWVASDTHTALPYIQADPYLKTGQLLPEKPTNSKAYFKQHAAYINLYQPVLRENNSIIGYLIVPINLNDIYQQLFLENEDNHYKGYPMIKNQDMLVVMHPSNQQIGLNIIEGRQSYFPGLDYSDLKRLDKYQKSHDEGSLVYQSYWWDESPPTKASKIGAFKWIDVGMDRWIVAITADLNERNETINYFIVTLLILLFFLLVFTFLCYRYIKSLRKKEAIEQENHQLLLKQEQQRVVHELEMKLSQQNKLESVGLLTASISHDINNFLTPIIGNTELLIDEYEDNSLLINDLTEILEAAKKGQRLTSDVLRFSKNDNLSNETDDLSEAVNNALALISKIIPKNIHLEIEIEPNLGRVRFDNLDIQTIIYNLMTNAYHELKTVRYPAKIKIALYQTPATLIQMINQQEHLSLVSGHFLTLEASDNGQGISKENTKKIFDPFFTTKSASEGTGLGLFTVKSIVTKYDWFLSLHSVENLGTSFYITIPLKEAKNKFLRG